MTEVERMETVFGFNWFATGVDKSGVRGGGRKVLLREPERCAECNRVFLSLYPISGCSEHDDLDAI